MDNGAIWLASYPKSGNTWLRCLLEAYRRNGNLDINDIRIASSDAGGSIIMGVSPIPMKDLGFNGQMLLRPAALMHLLSRLVAPTWIKTHFANIQPDGLPHCIPKEFTQKAVYMVRDPRSVLMSLSRFFGFSMEQAVAAMNNVAFTIGDNDKFSTSLISSWSNHVASWANETAFPVHVVYYENLIEDTAKELTDVLNFLEQDVNPETVKIAVEATEMSRIKQIEDDDGFRENTGERGDFFNQGGTRWKDELGQKWVDQIEKDHETVMRAMGYLDATVTELRSVE